MHPTLRKTGRYSAWTLLGLLTLIGLLFVLLQTGWAKGKILRSVTASANEALSGEMRADRLTGSLLFGVTLHDVQLRDARGEPVARLGDVEIDYSPFGLLGERVDVRRVRLEQPLLVVRRYADGAWNLAEVIAPGPPSDLKLRVTRLQIGDGSLVYEDRTSTGTSAPVRRAVADVVERGFSQSGPVDFGPLQSAFTANPAPPGAPGTAVADGIALSGMVTMSPDDGIGLALDSMRLEADTDTFQTPMLARVDRLDITSAPTRLRASWGELTVDAGSVWRDFETTVIFEEPPADPPPTEEAAAPAMKAFSVAWEELTVAPGLVGRFAPDIYLAEPVRVTADASGEGETASFRAEASVPEGGSLEFRGTTTWTVPSYNLSLKADALRTAAWLETTLPDSTINATAEFDGSGAQFDQLDARARLSMTESRIGDYQVDKLEMTASAREARLAEATLTFASPYFDADGTWRLDAAGRFDLGLDGQTPAGGLPKAVADRLGVEPDQIGRATLSSSASGAIDLETEAPADLLRWLEASMRWTAGEIDLKETRVDSSEGTLSLNLPEAAKGATERRFSMSGNGRLRGLKIPSYTIERGQFSGSADGRMRLDAPTLMAGLRSLTADGSTEFEGLRAPDLAVKRGNFTLSGSRSEPTADLPFTIDGTVTEMTAGAYAAGRASLQMRGTLPAASASTDRPLPYLKAAGRLSGTSVTGPSLEVGEFDGRFDLDGAPMLAGESLAFDLDARTSGASWRDYAAERASIDLDGTLVGAPEGADYPVLQTTTRGRVTGATLASPHGSVGQLDVRLNLDGAPLVPDKSADFQLNGSLSDARTEEESIGVGTVDLTGSIVGAPAGSTSPIARLTTRGRIGGSRIRSAPADIGQLDLRLLVEGAPMLPGEPLDFDIDGTLANATYGENAAGRATVDLDGTLIAAASDADHPVASFTTRGTIAGSQLKTAGFEFGGLRADIDAGGAPMLAGEPLNYDVTGTATRPRWGSFGSISADYRLSGSVQPADDGSLDRLAIKGTVGLDELAGWGMRIARASTDIDLAGPLDRVVGSLKATFDRLGLGDLTFGGARVNLNLPTERAFRLDARATPTLLPSLPLFLRSAGDYAVDPTTLKLDSLEVGRRGLSWSLPNPGSIALSEGKMTVESLSLQSRGRRMSLDGTYDLNKTDTLSNLVAKIGLLQLRELFDVDDLREMLPDDVRRELPEGALKKPQEAARQKAEEELKKRLPDAAKELPDEIEKKTPEQLKKELPKKLEEKATEELEKRLPEEIKKRVPEDLEKTPEKLKKLPEDAKKKAPEELKKRVPEDLKEKIRKQFPFGGPDKDSEKEKKEKKEKN